MRSRERLGKEKGKRSRCKRRSVDQQKNKSGRKKRSNRPGKRRGKGAQRGKVMKVTRRRLTISSQTGTILGWSKRMMKEFGRTCRGEATTQKPVQRDSCRAARRNS